MRRLREELIEAGRIRPRDGVATATKTTEDDRTASGTRRGPCRGGSVTITTDVDETNRRGARGASPSHHAVVVEPQTRVEVPSSTSIVWSCARASSTRRLMMSLGDEVVVPPPPPHSSPPHSAACYRGTKSESLLPKSWPQRLMSLGDERIDDDEDDATSPSPSTRLAPLTGASSRRLIQSLRDEQVGDDDANDNETSTSPSKRPAMFAGASSRQLMQSLGEERLDDDDENDDVKEDGHYDDDDKDWTYDGPYDPQTKLRHGDDAVSCCPDGRTKFLGSYRDGRRCAGTLVMPDRTYRGPFDNRGRYRGKGRLVRSDGAVYEGGFWAGEYHGTGTLIIPVSFDDDHDCNHDDRGVNVRGDAQLYTYAGGWIQGKREGFGVETMPLCGGAGYETYRGAFARDQRHGAGSLETMAEASLSVCTLSYLYKADGDTSSPPAVTHVEGMWRDGLPVDGLGWTIVRPDGAKYSGEARAAQIQVSEIRCCCFRNCDGAGGRMCGAGAAATVVRPHGRGVLRFAGGRGVFAGHFRDGVRHGRGICVYATGLEFDGWWENDEPVEDSRDRTDAVVGIKGAVPLTKDEAESVFCDSLSDKEEADSCWIEKDVEQFSSKERTLQVTPTSSLTPSRGRDNGESHRHLTFSFPPSA